MMKHIWFCGTGTVLSLVMMGLPCSVSCGELLGRASYFSTVSVMQGNWFPLLSVAFTVLSLVFFFRKELHPMIPISLGLSAVSQLLSWPMFDSMTVIGAAVICLQMIVAVQSTRMCSGSAGDKEQKSEIKTDSM